MARKVSTELEAFHTKRDKFFLAGTLDDQAQAFCEWLHNLDAGRRPLLVVASGGGDVDAALMMVSAIQDFRRTSGHITAHVVSSAHSGALPVVQACSYRTAEKHACFTMHSITIDVHQVAGSGLQAYVTELNLLAKEYAAIVLKRMTEGLTEDEVQSLTTQVTNCLWGSGPVITGDAIQMYRLGLIDAVVDVELPPRSELLEQMRKN